jgi:hypothetical protein
MSHLADHSVVPNTGHGCTVSLSRPHFTLQLLYSSLFYCNLQHYRSCGPRHPANLAHLLEGFNLDSREIGDDGLKTIGAELC